MKRTEHSIWVMRENKKAGQAEACCKNCGRDAVYQIIHNRYEFENFCPHCGAKMEWDKN